MGSRYKKETLAVHAGRQTDPVTGAVSPPLYLSTTFERDADGSYTRGYDYIRDGHPNHVMLEQTVAALEGGAHALAFSSGTAASLAVFSATGPGHIIATIDSYHGTLHQLTEVVAAAGNEISFVPTSSVAEVAAALRPDTRLLWIETPSNPLLQISDIRALDQLRNERDIVLAVDNTLATSILQQPLALGADLVVHSSTKYIGGHSDVAGGIVVADNRELMDKLKQHLIRTGAVPSAFDCWLQQRSLATLPMRVRTHSANALAIAQFLEQHKCVQAVHYPGLPAHPGYAIAQQQMSAFGGVLSFLVEGDKEAAMQVAARTVLFTRATSLGGVESLIEHRASIEGANSHAPPNLLRLSIGIENADDLVSDLAQALDR